MAGGILDQARNRLPIRYQGHRNRTDIYGNRVAPGGITNYRLPSFGGDGNTVTDETSTIINPEHIIDVPEDVCISYGGTWDSANNVCIKPPSGSDPEPITTSVNRTIQEEMDVLATCLLYTSPSPRDS